MTEVVGARERLLQAALRYLSAERAEPHAHSDAELEYADDLLVEAAVAVVVAESHR